ncbi:EF-hand domain-containing protein [Ensifer adhaerens]|uniref:EF-hand domain-containing protein n=1 Tax=Ensifer adhaerens TaxID=106592 RepID=UPI001CBE880F|nr:EF-hand domain-containing protein [Ensifer adhaerens]MBZ7920240.1 EF-hand domain-containing protein [Ensifer adhaerens]UAX92735.1 EF-hand domain-containing protein [Ensifer adhaerens]UAY00370.1 EF-hand domain-containing protein [Ensifer adhaerens]UAY07752.1 EF-hand domain-containing protein [Ensifer adhaerens]
MPKKTLILGVTALAVAVTGMAAPSFAAREKLTPEQRGERMIQRLDTNKDQKVSLDEFQARVAANFKTFDTNGDGQISADEMKAKREAFREARKAWREAKDKSGTEREAALAKLKEVHPGMLPGLRPKAFKRVDTDGNGSLSENEVSSAAETMFKRHDKNGDGVIDAADFTKKI